MAQALGCPHAVAQRPSCAAHTQALWWPPLFCLPPRLLTTHWARWGASALWPGSAPPPPYRCACSLRPCASWRRARPEDPLSPSLTTRLARWRSPTHAAAWLLYRPAGSGRPVPGGPAVHRPVAGAVRAPQPAGGPCMVRGAAAALCCTALSLPAWSYLLQAGPPLMRSLTSLLRLLCLLCPQVQAPAPPHHPRGGAAGPADRLLRLLRVGPGPGAGPARLQLRMGRAVSPGVCTGEGPTPRQRRAAGGRAHTHPAPEGEVVWWHSCAQTSSTTPLHRSPPRAAEGAVLLHAVVRAAVPAGHVHLARQGSAGHARECSLA